MLAKLIIRIAVLGLPESIRQKYLRAWLAELEQIKQEAPEESLAFATSLFWNIPKMRKVQTKRPPPVRKTLGKFLLTGSTLAAVLVVLIQWSSSPLPILPTPISPTPNREKAEDISSSVKIEENAPENIEENASEFRDLEETPFEDDVSVSEPTQAPPTQSDFLPFIIKEEASVTTSTSSSAELTEMPPASTRPDASLNGPLARATVANEVTEEESISMSEAVTSVPPQAPASITQTSPGLHSRSPVAQYSPMEQEGSSEEISSEGPNTIPDLESASEYVLGFAQSEPETETSYEGAPTGAANTENLGMSSGARDNLGLEANQNSQDMLASIPSQAENSGRTFTEGFEVPALEESYSEVQLEDADEQILLAKQKELLLKEGLRRLAQDYVSSKKVSKEEAEVFVRILGELLELDKKTTKNYLDNLLKQIR